MHYIQVRVKKWQFSAECTEKLLVLWVDLSCWLVQLLRFSFSGNNLFQMRFRNVLNKTTYNDNYDRTCHKQQTKNFTNKHWVFVPQPLFQPGQMHLWGRSSLPSCALCDSSTFWQRTACSGSQATILSTFFPVDLSVKHTVNTLSPFSTQRRGIQCSNL